MNAEDASIEILLPRPAPCAMSAVSENARIVLVGQAAHSLASGELSTSLAIEEAATQTHCTVVPQCKNSYISMPNCFTSYQEEQGDWMVSKNHARR